MARHSFRHRNQLARLLLSTRPAIPSAIIVLTLLLPTPSSCCVPGEPRRGNESLMRVYAALRAEIGIRVLGRSCCPNLDPCLHPSQWVPARCFLREIAVSTGDPIRKLFTEPRNYIVDVPILGAKNRRIPVKVARCRNGDRGHRLQLRLATRHHLLYPTHRNGK